MPDLRTHGFTKPASAPKDSRSCEICGQGERLPWLTFCRECNRELWKGVR